MEELTVLVVDDEPLIGMMMADTLNDGGLKTIFVTSGEEAVDLLKERPQEFCALITDINLGAGRMRGWDVARQARVLKPETPVVYITGDSGDDWASQGVSNSLLIAKPFATSQILIGVTSLLNQVPLRS